MDRWLALRVRLEEMLAELNEIVWAVVDDEDGQLQICKYKGKREAIQELIHEIKILEQSPEPMGDVIR